MMINVRRFGSVTKMSGYEVDDWKLGGGEGRGGWVSGAPYRLPNGQPMVKVARIWNWPPQECMEIYLHITYKHFAVSNILASSLQEYLLWACKMSVCQLILLILSSVSFVKLVC